MLKTGRMASSSYTKIFFPCSENGADVNVVDVIQSATQADAATLPGNGSRIRAPFVSGSSALGSGSFPTIAADSDFIYFVTAGAMNVTGNICIGAHNGIRLRILESGAHDFNDGTNTITWNAAITDKVNPRGYAIVGKRGQPFEFIQADATPVEPNSATTTSSLAVNLPDIMVLSTMDAHSIALFEFPDGLPSDYKEAIAWMGERHAVDQKVIWPAWETK